MGFVSLIIMFFLFLFFALMAVLAFALMVVIFGALLFGIISLIYGVDKAKAKKKSSYIYFGISILLFIGFAVSVYLIIV